MRRREFLGTIGSAAIWPLAARAQDRERVRHIGVLVPAAADDPVWQARSGAFLQALAILGWTIGRNVHLDTRWASAYVGRCSVLIDKRTVSRSPGRLLADLAQNRDPGL